MDQLPRLGKRELICLLSFTCNYVVFVWRGFLFLWVLGMGYVILLWHSLSLPYNYFANIQLIFIISEPYSFKFIVLFVFLFSFGRKQLILFSLVRFSRGKQKVTFDCLIAQEMLILGTHCCKRQKS